MLWITLLITHWLKLERGTPCCRRLASQILCLNFKNGWIVLWPAPVFTVFLWGSFLKQLMLLGLPVKHPILNTGNISQNSRNFHHCRHLLLNPIIHSSFWYLSPLVVRHSKKRIIKPYASGYKLIAPGSGRDFPFTYSTVQLATGIVVFFTFFWNIHIGIKGIMDQWSSPPLPTFLH